MAKFELRKPMRLCCICAVGLPTRIRSRGRADIAVAAYACDVSGGTCLSGRAESA